MLAKSKEPMSPELIALVESYEYFPNKSGNLDAFALAAFNLGRRQAKRGTDDVAEGPESQREAGLRLDFRKDIPPDVVIAAIRIERSYLDRIWSGTARGREPELSEWIGLIDSYMQNIIPAGGQSKPLPDEFVLGTLRKVATLCIACLEVHGGPRP